MNHAPISLAPPPEVDGSATGRRVAVVLFNLGGPDQPASIRPFLLNLFRDPAILRVPFIIRPLLARIIARARIKPATENYALLGGKSPLLELTQRQADLLQADLRRDLDASCFIAMRYWHPFAAETARAVAAFRPDRILLLPLYPQFSTTTTGSSLSDWRRQAANVGLCAETTTLCCWFADQLYVEATSRLLRRSIIQARSNLEPGQKLRILFSAHGLPQIIVDRGDPYQYQVQRTAEAVLASLKLDGQHDEAEADAVVCYQSRATPQKWLDPSTEQEIERAAADGSAILIVPIAFVSDHSETLVELDVEYRDLAKSRGVPGYFRVPAQNDDTLFIEALGSLARRALMNGPGLCSFRGGGLCSGFADCPHQTGPHQTGPHQTGRSALHDAAVLAA